MTILRYRNRDYGHYLQKCGVKKITQKPVSHGVPFLGSRQIQTFIDNLFKDFKIASYYDKLKLPEGHYERDGIQGVRIRTSNDNNGSRNSITDWF